MRAQKSKGTGPETALRRELHRRGLRFRVQSRPAPLAGTRRTVDIVLGPSRVAVDVRGCFWHGCGAHYRPSASNQGYWSPKIDRNRERDRDTERLLTEAGWEVVVVWEHEAVSDAADRVEAAAAARRPAARRPQDQGGK